MKLNLGGRWDEERDGSIPYGPGNVPRPPHHARPERRAFAWCCLIVLGIIGACICVLVVSGR